MSQAWKWTIKLSPIAHWPDNSHMTTSNQREAGKCSPVAVSYLEGKKRELGNN